MCSCTVFMKKNIDTNVFRWSKLISVNWSKSSQIDVNERKLMWIKGNWCKSKWIDVNEKI